jgi:hypothetical protein
MPVTISVTVSASGISVSPSSASVNRGDAVTWNVISGGEVTNLTVSFPIKTPFNAQQLTQPGNNLEGSVLANAGTTAYGYVIAAVVDGVQSVGPPPMGPEIIVM